MRIGLEAAFLFQPHTGRGRHTRELLRALARADRENEYVVFVPEELPAGFRLPENFHLRPLPCARKPWERHFTRGLDTTGLDLLHLSYFYRPARFPSCRLVATLHDLIYRDLLAHFPGPGFPWKLLSLEMLSSPLRDPRLAARFDGLVAVTEAVKRDAVRYLRVPPERVRVARSGVGEAFRPAEKKAVAAAKERHGIEEDYVFYCGGMIYRKNLGRLAEAWLSIPRSVRGGMPLVLAGQGWWRSRHERIARPEPGAILLPGHVLDEDLPALYSGARFFVSPSLAEGFGMPVAEAMRCGTPVLCSDIPCHREVGGDGALYAVPWETGALREKMIRLLSEAPLRERLSREGRSQAERLTWDATAGAVLDAWGTAADFHGKSVAVPRR